MAGTLLLIPKNSYSSDLYNKKKQKLIDFINQYYKPYFNKINIRETSDLSTVIEFRKNDSSKFFADNKKNWLTYEGIVFALEKTKTYTAQELLELYLQDPENFPNNLDGHFVIKVYDASRNTYIIINDILKNKINYFSENDDFILFTPFVLLSGIINKPEPDLHAFNEFMWRYYMLSERSIFKNVSKLKGASRYEVKDGLTKREKYWDWPDKFNDLPFQSTVDKMAESMKETARLVHDHFGTTCIDFTMGQDSRQVVAAFTNQNIPMTTTIFGQKDYYEVQRTEEMAERHSIEHHSVQLDDDFLQNPWFHFEKSLLLGNGEMPAHILARIMYMREKQKQWGHAILNGHCGHFYKNGLWDEMYTFNLYREPNEFKIKMFLKLRAMSSNYKDDIFNPEYIQIKNDSIPYFTDMIKYSIRDYTHSPVSMQVDRFNIYHWLNFTHVSNNALNLIFDSLSPLYFRRNLELAIQIPVKWKFNLAKFQRALVYQLDPKLAAEKTDFGGVNMIPKNFISTIPFHLRYYFFQSARMRNKLKMKLGMKVVTHIQEAWDYQPVYQGFYDTQEVQDLLDYTHMNLTNIIDKNEWQSLRNNFQDKSHQSINNLDYILKIAGVEYLLKLANQLA